MEYGPQPQKQELTGEETGENFFQGFISDEHKERTYKEQKYIALYKCRKILSQIGTMEERRVCTKKLKLMEKKGLDVI